MATEEQAATKSPPRSTRRRHGPVMPIGGAEEKDPGRDQDILTRFIELAGGKRARIAVIPTASEEAAESGKRYVDIFSSLGARAVDVLEINERTDANAGPAIELLEAASGIFITGGDQARLVSLLVGTQVMECIRERNGAGVIVAGTSAGASIVAAHLMSGENDLPVNSNDAAARKGMVDLVAGFGLLQDLIIDQHFSQRGRLGRLIAGFAANPGLVGIGLDEDTAVLVTDDGALEVLGSGMVTLVDGRNVTSDFFARKTGEVLTVIDSHLFVLGPGRKFNLVTRRPFPLDETTEPQ